MIRLVPQRRYRTYVTTEYGDNFEDETIAPDKATAKDIFISRLNDGEGFDFVDDIGEASSEEAPLLEVFELEPAVEQRDLADTLLRPRSI